MALVTDFSRLRLKRLSTSGQVPTIPSTSEPDETWLPTDLLIGEACVNTADDKAWIRTNNGIKEINLNGLSSPEVENDLGNTGATLTVDLSLGHDFYAVADNNFTLEFSNPPSGTDEIVSGQISITQDGAGSRVLTEGTNVIAQGGITPILTTTSGAEDVLYYTYRERTGKLYISRTNDWK